MLSSSSLPYLHCTIIVNTVIFIENECNVPYILLPCCTKGLWWLVISCSRLHSTKLTKTETSQSTQIVFDSTCFLRWVFVIISTKTIKYNRHGITKFSRQFGFGFTEFIMKSTVLLICIKSLKDSMYFEHWNKNIPIASTENKNDAMYNEFPLNFCITSSVSGAGNLREVHEKSLLHYNAFNEHGKRNQKYLSFTGATVPWAFHCRCHHHRRILLGLGYFCMLWRTKKQEYCWRF